MTTGRPKGPKSPMGSKLSKSNRSPQLGSPNRGPTLGSNKVGKIPRSRGKGGM